MTIITNKEIAARFVEEYLDQYPEFISVAEFMEDAFPAEDQENADNEYGEVYTEVCNYMNMIRDRLGDIFE